MEHFRVVYRDVIFCHDRSRPTLFIREIPEMQISIDGIHDIDELREMLFQPGIVHDDAA
jgi:hypothetical protein